MSRTERMRRRERGESRNFLLLLLLIVGVVALIQGLLVLTMTRLGASRGSILQHGRAPAPMCERIG